MTRSVASGSMRHSYVRTIAVDEQLVLVAGPRAGREGRLQRAHRDVGLTGRQQIADAAFPSSERPVHTVPAEVTALAVQQEHQSARAPHQRPNERIGVLPEIRHTLVYRPVSSR